MRSSTICLTALLGLSGCFSLSKGEPLQQHYVLGGGGSMDESNASATDLTGLRVGGRRLQIAAYLNTPFIVMRRGSSEIGFSEFHRWGEPLDAGINRALATSLSAGAPFDAVDVAPWPVRQEYDYLIQLHILRFEGVSADGATSSTGEAHVLASWEILRQSDEAVIGRGTTDSRVNGWTVGDYPGLVTLLDSGVEVVARDLIAGLRGLTELTVRAP